MVTDNKLYKVAITVDGNYVHGKKYDTLTQVYYAEEDGGDGCSYVSIKPNQNIKPDTDDSVWKKSTQGSGGNAIRYTKQILTNVQKAQARENIGIIDLEYDELTESIVFPPLSTSISYNSNTESVVFN